MPELITAITEFDAPAPDYGTEEGFKVETTEQTITLAISNDQSCCENWGYFLSEDDLDKFVGADLREVAITETNLSSKVFNPAGKWDEEGIYLDEGDTMFVNLSTDRGVLQFVAYNSHNGYYGHTARIESQQLKTEVRL